ncbi:sensor histidine kinase [Streptomyces capparidis]
MPPPDAGFAHRALRYTSDAGFLGGTLPFLREGLRRGDSLLVVTGPEHRGLLRRALGGDARRVEFADAATWYASPARTLAAHHRYVQERRSLPGRVRVVGEPPPPGPGPAAIREWARYESLVNVALAGSGALLLCPYDADGLHPAVLAAAARTHPELASDAGEPTGSAHYTDPEAFAAECDAEPLPPPRGQVRELEFTHGDLSVVRAFVEVCARHAALDPARRQDLVFAVNEVATNALVHGGGQGRLRYWREDGAIVMETEDRGGGAAGAASPFPGQLPADPATRRGHGLWAVRQLCDLLQVRFRAGGSTVRLTYRLR